MKHFLAVLLSLAIITGCSNLTRLSTEDGYHYVYHFVENVLGRISITSGHHNESVDYLPENFHEVENFAYDGRLKRNWADIAIYRYGSQSQCLDSTDNLNVVFDQLLADDILPDSDVLLNLFFVPHQQFRVRKESRGNKEFDFYFPIDLCQHDPAIRALAEAADKLVHETYHIQIQRLKWLQRPGFNKQIEEKNAHVLGYCNWVTADAQTTLNTNYFDIDYDYEIERARSTRSSRVQKRSELGRLKAKQVIHQALLEGEPMQDFCLTNIQRINQQTFGI